MGGGVGSAKPASQGIIPVCPHTALGSLRLLPTLLPLGFQAGSVAQARLWESLAVPSSLLGRKPALGLLIKARVAVARQQGCWSRAIVTLPRLLQFALVEEKSSWRNSLICSPVGTSPISRSMVEGSPC